jgi:hypothetical protein
MSYKTFSRTYRLHQTHIVKQYSKIRRTSYVGLVKENPELLDMAFTDIFTEYLYMYID